MAICSIASSTRHFGFSSSRCCDKKAGLTVVPVTNFPAATSSWPVSTLSRVVLPAPLTPAIPMRSPGPTFQSKPLNRSRSPTRIVALCNSYTVLPRRALANASSSTLLRGGGSFSINSFAASMRNLGLLVRAGAPRRSQANSFLMSMFRFCSSTLDCRMRSALAKT